MITNKKHKLKTATGMIPVAVFSVLKAKYAYIALFNYDDDGISIEFPDLHGNGKGKKVTAS